MQLVADSAWRLRRGRHRATSPRLTSAVTRRRDGARSSMPGAHGYFAGGAGGRADAARERRRRSRAGSCGRGCWSTWLSVTPRTTVLGERLSMPIAGRAGRVPAARARRTARRDGAGGGGRRDGDVPVDARHGATGRGGGRGARRAARWFQLYCFRDRGRDQGAARRGGRVGVRGDRADRGRPAPGAAGARPAERLPAAGRARRAERRGGDRRPRPATSVAEVLGLVDPALTWARPRGAGRGLRACRCWSRA